MEGIKKLIYNNSHIVQFRSGKRKLSDGLKKRQEYFRVIREDFPLEVNLEERLKEER